MVKYVLWIFCCLGCVSTIHGQTTPTIPENQGSTVVVPENDMPDSTTIVRNTFFDIFTGNPGRAAFYGLIIPGGGQIYNRKWWKLPLVYGLEGYLVYSIYTNTRSYNRFQQGYLDKLAGKEANVDGITDVTQLRRRRDAFRKSREYAWVFFIGGRLITIFEAFIDRHLMEFDVSDDLTFSPINTSIGTFNAITYTIPLNKKKTYTFKNLLE